MHTNQSGIGNFGRFSLIIKVEICVPCTKNQMHKEKPEIDFHWRLVVSIFVAYNMHKWSLCCCSCCSQNARIYLYFFYWDWCNRTKHPTWITETNIVYRNVKWIKRNKKQQQQKQIYARIKGENVDWLMCPVKGRKLVNFL